MEAASGESGRSRGRWADVASVVVLVLGFGLALGLAVAAFAVGFCGLFGEQCTAAEERNMDLLSLASIGVFVLVPIVVAIARRQARWLLAPVIEATLIAAVFTAYEVF